MEPIPTSRGALTLNTDWVSFLAGILFSCFQFPDRNIDLVARCARITGEGWSFLANRSTHCLLHSVRCNQGATRLALWGRNRRNGCSF